MKATAWRSPKRSPADCPSVSTDTGAIELVGDEAGILVPPGDVEALAAALAQLVGDTRTRERLEQGARRVRERLPTWEDAGCKMAEALAQFTIHN
jgi:glycosyltransferase involved in cell wall biosynthesis